MTTTFDTDRLDDETFEALEELYREGKIDHVPGIGSDTEPGFTLTDAGDRAAEDLLREDDDALLFLVSLFLDDVDRPGDTEAVSRMLVKAGRLIRDEIGRNIFRVMADNPDAVPGIDADDLPETFLEAFDP